LYGRRWEQEIFYKELKVDMRSTPCLRSHTPLTAAQEIAALISNPAASRVAPHCRRRHCPQASSILPAGAAATGE